MLIVEILGNEKQLWLLYTEKDGYHTTSLKLYATHFREINEAEDAIFEIKKIHRYSDYSFEINPT